MSNDPGEQGQMHHDHGGKHARSLSGANLVLICFLAIVGFFLAMEHRAHLYGILPWLILAICPLMHIFMHGGHGGHGHGKDE